MKIEVSRLSALTLILSLTCGACLSWGQVPDAAGSKAGMAQLLGDLKASSASSADPTLKSLGGDLGSQVSALSKSLGENPDAQQQLQSVMQSLAGNDGAASLGALHKLSQAKLTPGQTQLAKDVYHSGSAYLVQKNFGSLEGSQTEVSQVVNSLRKGNYVETLPALKKIGENAQLTPSQKGLLTSLADQYAPGLKKGSDLLKGIPGFK